MLHVYDSFQRLQLVLVPLEVYQKTLKWVWYWMESCFGVCVWWGDKGQAFHTCVVIWCFLILWIVGRIPQGEREVDCWNGWSLEYDQESGGQGRGLKTHGWHVSACKQIFPFFSFLLYSLYPHSFCLIPLPSTCVIFPLPRSFQPFPLSFTRPLSRSLLRSLASLLSLFCSPLTVFCACSLTLFRAACRKCGWRGRGEGKLRFPKM